jgi:hypothetical protein
MDTAMTAAQRAIAAALLFLGAAAVAGVAPVETGVQYRTFGIVEGVFALLLTYVLLQRRAWMSPAGVPGWAAVIYGTLATAQIAEFLFPPPGVVEWVVVATLALSGWGALSRGPRRRIVFGLATLSLLMALLRYSVIPVLWGVGPQPGDLLGVGDMAQGARRVFADHQPIRPVGQLLGFAAMAMWALATRLVWPVLPSRGRRGRDITPLAKSGSHKGLTGPVDSYILGAPREPDVVETTQDGPRAVDDREQG